MDEIVDSKTIEDLLGISGRTVRDLTVKGVIEKVAHGKYNIKTGIPAYIDYKVKLAIKAVTKDDTDYAEARRRNELAKAVLGEIAIEKAEGQLVDAKDMELSLVSLFTDIKTRLRAIPARCSDTIAHQKSDNVDQVGLRADINETLSKEVDEALEDLAQWKLPKS